MAGGNTPIVSVVLPFRNAQHTLDEAIRSILKQTFQDFELVLVNNASTDNSRAVASQFVSEGRVVLIDEPTRGVIFAANRGIQQSKGTYVMRMDADDYSFPERMDQQVMFLDENPGFDVVSGLVEYIGPLANEGFKTYVDWVNAMTTETQIQLNQFVEFPLVNPTMMFRHSLFSQFGYYQEGDFPEDYEFFLRLQSRGVRMGKVETPVLSWKDSPTRLTRTDKRYTHEAFFRIKARYLAKWLADHNPFHPNVLIWGAGRVSRRRSDLLKAYGIEVIGYIDVKAGDNIIHYTNIPSPDKCFIVSYVNNRGAREEIRRYLINRSFLEGLHFILAS